MQLRTCRWTPVYDEICSKVGTRLLVASNGADLHEALDALAENAALFAGGLVDALDGLATPIGPVEEATELRQSERMRRALQ